MKQPKPNIPLLVTTAHRGVFFGYGQRSDAPTIDLEKARMCIYWSSDLRGVLGLATAGPSGNCKIGPAVEHITLRDVTSVVECTPEAAANWEKGIWS